MDLEGRTAGIMPGLGLSVPGRKRTGSERSQGILSRPTTMTSPVFRPSRRVAPNETLSPFAKNTKIVETNSTNRLESIKPRKNELKTNPERSEKQLDRGAIRVKSSHAPRIAVRAKLFHLAKACRAETNALADDGELIFDDRSGNVVENKGTVLESTTPDPSLCKEGNSGLPSSDEEGRGWCAEELGQCADLKVGATRIAGTKRECL